MLVWLARSLRHPDHRPLPPPGPGNLSPQPPRHSQGCQGVWKSGDLQTRSSSLWRSQGSWHLLRPAVRGQLQQGECQDDHHDLKTSFTRWTCGLSPLMCRPKRFSPVTLWPSMLTPSCITRYYRFSQIKRVKALHRLVTPLLVSLMWMIMDSPLVSSRPQHSGET